MDTLTFSAPILFRHLTFSEAKKQPISEINLQAALDGLDMNMSQVCGVSLLLSLVDALLVCRPMYSAGLRLSGTDKRRRPQVGIEVNQGIRWTQGCR